MKTIIILYPESFNCYGKFSRKVSKILQNIENYSIIYPSDANGFIGRFFSENMPTVSLAEDAKWREKQITHGIIFDDGEEFISETEYLKNKEVALRLIKIKITRVINIKTDSQYKNIRSTPDYEYIGRGAYWGNPYSMYEDGDDRDEVIRKFKYDFDYDKFPNKDKSELYKLAGKKLGCFCKPKDCHGDILAGFLNSWDDGK